MKILLIEDDRELAESMKFQLEKEGYETAARKTNATTVAETPINGISTSVVSIEPRTLPMVSTALKRPV